MSDSPAGYPIAELSQPGRFQYQIKILTGPESSWGNCWIDGVVPFTAWGTRRGAERKARRLLRKYATWKARQETWRVGGDEVPDA